MVAREGNPAPGTGGAEFTSNDFDIRGDLFERLVLNNAGQVALLGDLTGTGIDSNNDAGIWSEGGGNGLVLVARDGNIAPDTGGAKFVGIVPDNRFLHSQVINNAGQIAFSGFLSGTGVDSSNNSGIWSEGGGNGLAIVARAGDNAPGTGGAKFSKSGLFPGFVIGDPALNSAGQVAFSGRLDGTGVNGTDQFGIWSEGGGAGLALVVRTGDSAPGTSNGVNFSSFGRPVLNAAGHTAFVGHDNTGNVGIWSEGGGNGLALVTRSGEAAPGAGGERFNILDTPVLNDAGQTAFIARLDVFGSNRLGIWAEDRSGTLRLIALENDQFDVDDGPGTDFRTIVFLSFIDGTGNEDGRPSGFNDRGQVAFLASFTDGTSGVFVSNIATIPEPSALLLATLAVVGMLVRRRGW